MTEQRQKYMKAYYQKNKERIQEYKNYDPDYQKQYYEEHKEDAYFKKYREEHKEYFRSYARNNYRKKCGLPPLKNKI